MSWFYFTVFLSKCSHFGIIKVYRKHFSCCSLPTFISKFLDIFTKIFHSLADSEFFCDSKILLQAFIYHKENLIVKIPEATKGNVVIHTSNPHIPSSSAIKLIGRSSIAILHPRDGVWEHTKLQKERNKVCVSGEKQPFSVSIKYFRQPQAQMCLSVLFLFLSKLPRKYYYPPLVECLFYWLYCSGQAYYRFYTAKAKYYL